MPTSQTVPNGRGTWEGVYSFTYQQSFYVPLYDFKAFRRIDVSTKLDIFSRTSISTIELKVDSNNMRWRAEGRDQ